MNRYERKMKHKFEMKKNFANRWYYGEGNDASWTQLIIRNPSVQYWKYWSYSARKRFAKIQTNRLIRAAYRNILVDDDHELDVGFGKKKSYYRKIFDYWWTVF